MSLGQRADTGDADMTLHETALSPTHRDDSWNSATTVMEKAQGLLARMTPGQIMAALLLLERKEAQNIPDDRSTIAFLFDGWLACFQHANGNAGRSLTDEDMKAINGALNATADAIVALPPEDAADVQGQVFVALIDDDPDDRSPAGRLLIRARTALGIAA